MPKPASSASVPAGALSDTGAYDKRRADAEALRADFDAATFLAKLQEARDAAKAHQAALDRALDLLEACRPSTNALRVELARAVSLALKDGMLLADHGETLKQASGMLLGVVNAYSHNQAAIAAA